MHKKSIKCSICRGYPPLSGLFLCYPFSFRHALSGGDDDNNKSAIEGTKESSSKNQDEEKQ